MIGSDELRRRIRRLVLENSIEHAGEARPGPIVSRLLSTDPPLRSRNAEVAAAVAASLAEIHVLPLDQQEAELAALGGPEPALVRAAKPEGEGSFPDLLEAVDGKVVLRMAPFPSGALHIGNARMIFVNDFYRQRYHGRLLLVFDDTVGSEEKRISLEVFGVIANDLKIAGVDPDAVHYKSDRLPLVYDWARRVIERDGAYVCVCPAELLREHRAHGIACPERAQPRTETLKLWAKMLSGGFEAGSAVLRLRTDLADPDPAFRDRVLCRISDLDHPRVGHQWRVWPMLEFSWAVDDVELGITHVIRGKDLVIEDRMERYIWDLLGIRGPSFVHWGLLRVAEAKISKSKGSAQILSGEYDGWADPRLWSIASLDRRGITREALRKFTLSFGLSLADIEVPAETLYAENRQIIDPTTPRRSFVADPVRVEVQDYPMELVELELSNHPERPELGKRRAAGGPVFWLARKDVEAHLGEEIRLKDLINVALGPRARADGSFEARFTSRENRKLARLQWVGGTGAVPVDVLQPDGSHLGGLAEGALRQANPRDLYQFERVGFVRVEGSWVAGTEPVRVCYGHP